MPELLTPKQVARAIGVSESSLKRWCDQGRLQAIQTPGGHRRLPISSVMEFIRHSQQLLVNPEAIGLPKGLGAKQRTKTNVRDAIREALVAGDESACRLIVLNQYVEGVRLTHIFEDLTHVFRDIGSLWECGDLEVYRERRACSVGLRVLHELRTLLPAVPEGAPVAIGATPEGDVYSLPTNMLELVLRQNGWQATALGSSLPVDSLIVAIRDHRPKLFWLSVSYVADEAKLLADVRKLAEVCGLATAFLVGGRALTPDLIAQLPPGCHINDLAEFEARLPNFA